MSTYMDQHISEVIAVWRKSPIRLEPIRKRVRELEKQRAISRVCTEAKISRNQLYMMLRGETNTREETLAPLLEALGLTWQDVTA